MRNPIKRKCTMLDFRKGAVGLHAQGKDMLCNINLKRDSTLYQLNFIAIIHDCSLLMGFFNAIKGKKIFFKMPSNIKSKVKIFIIIIKLAWKTSHVPLRRLVS